MSYLYSEITESRSLLEDLRNHLEYQLCTVVGQQINIATLLKKNLKWKIWILQNFSVWDDYLKIFYSALPLTEIIFWVCISTYGCLC